jgi:hypothetical protein
LATGAETFVEGTDAIESQDGQAGQMAFSQEKTMIRKAFSLLWVAGAMYAVPLDVRAQAPGLADPQALPGVPALNGGMGLWQGADPALRVPLHSQVRPQEKDRNDNTSWMRHMGHAIGHLALSAEPAKSARTPGASFREPMVWVPEVRPTLPAVTAVSEVRMPSYGFTSEIGRAGSSVARGFSGWGGRGVLAGIGGAIMAALGAVFGKKNDS